MKHDWLTREFERRDPWATGFIIDGKTYGNRKDMRDGAMEQRFFQEFPAAKNVMELGSCEGARTIHLAKQAEMVLGIEGREHNIENAKFIKQIYGLDNVQFVRDDFCHRNIQDVGIPFKNAGHTTWFLPDTIYCVGVLYHTPEPWKLIDNMASAAPNVFIWTHVAKETDTECLGMRFKRYTEHGMDDPNSGLQPYSLWPTETGLLTMLRKFGGFESRVIDRDENKSGQTITVVCRRADVEV